METGSGIYLVSLFVDGSQYHCLDGKLIPRGFFISLLSCCGRAYAQLGGVADAPALSFMHDGNKQTDYLVPSTEQHLTAEQPSNADLDD